MPLILAPLLIATQTSDLSWLAGHWCTEPKNGASTCEAWTAMDKGVMRGTGTTRMGERIKTNETMSITVGDSGLVFHARPANQPPTDFRAVKVDARARSVTFEAAAHDYPQRVRYWREGETLMAEISLANSGRAMRWKFYRMH